MAKEQTDGDRASIVALIAWLSTGLLTAGLGTMTDPSTQNLWLRAGCFGLVAAVGLDVAARMRAPPARAKSFRALKRRCERSSGIVCRRTGYQHRTAHGRRTASDSATTDRQRESGAIRGAALGVQSARQGLRVPARKLRRRAEQRHAEVIGRLENVSNSGFGMLLAEKLAVRLVIISILPPTEQEFELLAEILWCDPYPDGRMRAGGRLLRVLPSGSRGSADCPSLETEEIPIEAAC